MTCACGCGGTPKKAGSRFLRGHDNYRRRKDAWDFIVDQDGCWIWQLARGGDGYGWAGRELAHVALFEQVVGPVPDGLQLDHLCRKRLCVNPAHLEPVTRRENILRGESPSAQNARKTHCHRGHPFDEANTGRWDPRGRACRACHAEKERRRRALRGVEIARWAFT